WRFHVSNTVRRKGLSVGGRLTPHLSPLTIFQIEHALHFREKFLHADRLGLVAIKSFSQHRLSVMGHGRRRDRDGSNAVCFWVGPQLLQSRDSVHPRQLNVHEDESGRLLQRQLESFFSRLGLYGLVAFDLKHVPDKLPVLLVVFDDQYQFTSHIDLGFRSSSS